MESSGKNKQLKGWNVIAARTWDSKSFLICADCIQNNVSKREKLYCKLKSEVLSWDSDDWGLAMSKMSLMSPKDSVENSKYIFTNKKMKSHSKQFNAKPSYDMGEVQHYS